MKFSLIAGRAFALFTLGVMNLAAIPRAAAADALLPAPVEGEHIVLIGNALAERMQYFGYFETGLHLRFPDKRLTVRNLGHSGDTPAYRPRAGRKSQWAIPDGEKFRPEFKMHLGQGHYPSEDEWLTIAKADTVLAFFGFNESFDGPARVDNFAAEVAAFVDHTRAQTYNGRAAPRLVLVSPIAFEDLSARRELPDGKAENANIRLYVEAMRRVAKDKAVPFIDAFTPTLEWYAQEAEPLTINGAHLSRAGDQKLGAHLVQALYGSGAVRSRTSPEALRAAVNDKNWYWLNDYRILNGVHVYGRRHNPFGKENYPQEIEKIRQMTVLRDERIWKLAREPQADASPNDAATLALPEVKTNFTRPIKYLGSDEAIKSFTLPDGYNIALFAAESEFPDLRSPVQMTFDNRGRLWVAVLPSYPHYRPGDEKPDDKILIYEDTDGDGRADRQTVFARGLHMPTGFEITPDGVYVSQQPNLVLLKDTNGDDQADQSELILHGFDSHDTHHSIHGFITDASGAIYMPEGRFLHSQVETPYGCIRSNDGGVYRFDAKSWRLERFSQYDYHNPWGIAFDEWGQNFIADASSGDNFWLLPLSLKLPFGVEYPEETKFTDHRVRPTAGAEFIHSRHFPDEVQGDFLVNNTIGFLGTKQHAMREDGAGFRGKHRVDLVKSSDPNFRPVDMEFAPDGSLYLVDWHNALIGHMQHSARDPNRNHEHGRIYRITYPARPLVKKAVVAGESIPALLEHLKEPEYRTRYRTHRELRGRSAGEVLPAVSRWVNALDPKDASFDRHLLQALWVTWGQRKVDRGLLGRCLEGRSHQLRAAAVRVLRHDFRKIPDHVALLKRAAADAHPRVRLEALVAASWIGGDSGAEIVVEAMKHPLDSWMTNAVLYAIIPLKDNVAALLAAGRLDPVATEVVRPYLASDVKFGGAAVRPPVGAGQEATSSPAAVQESASFKLGREVYSRDGHCSTCHQADGAGLPKIYPPVAGSEWVTGSEERLIKLVLHGLTGDITVKGERYAEGTTPPMPGFGGMLSEQEIAAVVTYVRAAFGNKAGEVTPELVRKVKAATQGRNTFYRPEELLREHPLPGARP